MNVLISGAAGKMGTMLFDALRERFPTATAAGVDPSYTGEEGFAKIEDVTGKYDVVVDFSHHTAAIALAAYAVQTNTPLVVCTTGHTEEEKAAITAAAKTVPVFYAGNTSVGIAVLSDMTRRVAAAMPNAEIEIVEIHHDKKKDAPSGTALMLAEAAKDVRPELFIKCGRSGEGAREKNEIGIASMRYGNVVGVHEIVFSTETETVTLKHEAHTRKVFAEGALAAAQYVLNAPAGLYTMRDVLKG